MSDQHTSPESAASTTNTDTERVGEHLVISKTVWVPGSHPEPWMSHEAQSGYFEQYFSCLQCGAERLTTQQFSARCPGEKVIEDTTEGDG